MPFPGEASPRATRSQCTSSVGRRSSSSHWLAGCGSYSTSYTGTSSASYTVTGLSSNTAYCFEVESIDSGGTSAASTAITDVATLYYPGAPTSLTVGVVTTTTIPVTWTNPSGGGLLNNTVYYKSGASCGSGMTAINPGVVETAQTITGLSSATEYSIEVTVWNATGQSADSSCVQGTTLPTAPTSLTVVPTALTTTLLASWTLPSGTLSNVTVYWFSGAACTGAVTVHSTGSGATTSYTITGLTTDHQYAAEVQAWSAGGASVDSSCVVGLVASIPAAPTGLSVSPTALTTTLSASWTLPTGDTLVNVTVYWFSGTSCSGATSAHSSGSGSTTSYTITGLTANDQYSVKVQAWNGTGGSADSSCVSGLVASVPTAPGSFALAATALTTTLAASWTLTSGQSLVNVTVYWTTTAACGGVLTAHSMASGSATSYTITGLTTDTLYYAEATAWNATGQSLKSTCSHAVTASVPPAPTGLSVNPTALTTTLAASWTLPSGDSLVNVTLYWFSGASCSGGVTVHSSGSGSTTSYTITGLTTNDRYAVEVQAWNATGGSSDSSCVSGVVASIPPAPTGLSVSPTALTTTLSTSWTLPSGDSLVNVTVYWFSGASCSGAVTVHSSGSGSTTSYTITGLTTKSQYAVEVQAWNGTGPSPDSTCVVGVTASVPAAPRR